MNNTLKVESVRQLNALFGKPETEHPLITIIDFSAIKDYQTFVGAKIYSELYSIMLKQQCDTTFRYGREKYDFQEGTLVFVAPGQVVEIEDEIESPKTKDWGIFFHPDLLFGTNLNNTIKDYSFFNYTTNEALQVSLKEKDTLNDIVVKLEEEISMNIDKHSQRLIVSNIELLLNYCTRYFDRQFITRAKKNYGTLTKFEALLNKYFDSELVLTNGTPTVKHLATELNMSSNYMSDLLKKETGLSALEHIHKAIAKEAKRKLLLPDNSISSVAYELGFEYPQYFTRLFKKETGMTPKEFRNLN
ncbi:MAG: helix-turn-helix domain-containing protein [Saprospiraceae bacterium]